MSYIQVITANLCVFSKYNNKNLLPRYEFCFSRIVLKNPFKNQARVLHFLVELTLFVDLFLTGTACFRRIKKRKTKTKFGFTFFMLNYPISYIMPMPSFIGICGT
jgi:hypothetical protein